MNSASPHRFEPHLKFSIEKGVTRPLPLVLGALCLVSLVMSCVLYTKLKHESVLSAQETDKLELSNKALKDENQRLRNQLDAEMSNQANLVSRADVSSVGNPNSRSVAASFSSGERRAPNTEGRSRYLAAEVDRYVSLTDEQREKLLAVFQDHESDGNAEDDVSRNKALADDIKNVIGEDQYEQFQNEKFKSDQNAAQEALENRATILSKRAGLPSSVENQLPEILREVQIESLSASASDTSAEASDDGAPSLQQQMAQQFELQKAQAALLEQKLRPLLTDEEFNRLMAYQEDRLAASPLALRVF